ncbi:MAG: NFACT family protein [Spirochaetota bacterium]
MSLNWKEIDLVLSELDLVGSQIQKVLQPSFDSIVLGLYGKGHETSLFISVSHGACRIHRLSRNPPKNDRPLRFMECLRSRLRGGHVLSLAQLGDDRVVRMDIAVSRHEGEEGDGSKSTSRVYSLFARLWSGAGNIVLCDEGGIIIDALARRPAKGEVAGSMFEAAPLRKNRPSDPGSPAGAAPASPMTGADPGPVTPKPPKPPREFLVRELPLPDGRPDAGFNECVEAWYAQRGGELSRENLLELARERFEKRRRILETRIAALEAQAREFRQAGRKRELGDLIMANLGQSKEGHFLAVEDFYHSGPVSVEIDPALSLVKNANNYYEQAKKEARGLSEVEAEITRWKSDLEAQAAGLARLGTLRDPLLIAKSLDKGGTARTTVEAKYPGISLERSGWLILVGRSAKENDELLRRHVRGSDLWLHARDYAGSYVFIKARRDKSVPLEILLDAGQLALYYSKGREAGEGDLYYTFVKWLRRAKNGPKGLVIPTQEKNLHIQLDDARVRELRALSGSDQE